MANKSPNTMAIVEHKKKESESKKKKVLDVLEELKILNDPIENPISKSLICKKAGVSKTFLYTHQNELIEPINDAIKMQKQKLRTLPARTPFKDSSKDVLIKALTKRIENLEKENKDLKHKNSLLLGKLKKK